MWASASTEGYKGCSKTGRRGMRIATASVRTGFAMTGYKECGKAGGVEPRPYESVSCGA